MATGAYAQDYVGLRFFGLSIHPYGEQKNAHLMPLKLDDKAYLVQNLGAILFYEKDLYRGVLSAKCAVALYSDCAAQLGGFGYLGFRGRILSLGRHRLYGGMGPTFIFRRIGFSWRVTKMESFLRGLRQISTSISSFGMVEK